MTRVVANTGGFPEKEYVVHTLTQVLTPSRVRSTVSVITHNAESSKLKDIYFKYSMDLRMSLLSKSVSTS